MSSNAPRVVVVGSINVDLVFAARALPDKGETVSGASTSMSPGGKGANQAVAAARLGGAVAFVGAIGDDDHGIFMRTSLEDAGVDVSLVRTCEGARTGMASITVDAEGENTIVVAPGANDEIEMADVDRATEMLSRADVVMLQQEIPAPVVDHAARLAAELGTGVVLNAAPARAMTSTLSAATDLLIVNEQEAAFLAVSGGNGAENLRHLGIETCIVTRGSEGAEYVHGRESGSTECYDVEVVDTVGAGDAFSAACAVRWAEHRIGGSLDALGVMDMLWWAGAAGGLATTVRGAQPSMPTREAVRSLLLSRREAR